MSDQTFAYLYEAERAVIRSLGEIWNSLCNIVEDGPSRQADLNEMVAHIHALQQAVMSNAASRAYPQEFRTLGGTIARREATG
jgi:hypothetical protein